MLALGNQTLVNRTGKQGDAVLTDLVAEVLASDTDSARAGRTQDIPFQEPIEFQTNALALVLLLKWGLLYLIAMQKVHSPAGTRLIFGRKIRGALIIASTYLGVVIHVPPSFAQGYGGTGLSLEQMENLCQMAAFGGAAGRIDPTQYIDKTLQGRFAMGNSTMSQYKKQKAWFRSNCPAY